MTGDADPRRQLGKIALQQKLVVPGATRQARSAETVEFLRKLGEEHGVPAIDLTEEIVPVAALRLIPVEIALERTAFAFALTQDELKVAMAKPRDPEAVMELEFLAAKRIVPHVAPEVVVQHAIEHGYAALERGAEHFVGSGVTQERLAELGLGHVEPAPAPPEFLPAPPAAPSVPATVKEEPVATTSDPRAEPVGVPPAAGAAASGNARGATPAVSSAAAADTRASDLRAKDGRPTNDGAVGGAARTTVMQIRVPAPAGATAGATGSVLLAVSDRAARQALERALAADGASVIETDDGNAALALVRDRAPRLVVLDARLPAVPGWEVARRLTADGHAASTAIIVLSDIARDWRLAEDLRETYGVKHVVDVTHDVATLVQIVKLELDGKAYPPPPPALSPAAEARWSAGIAAFEKGDISRAIEEMEAGVRIDPDAFEMYYHLGLLHGRREDLFAAIRALDHAVALQPRSFAALKNLAVVCQRAGLRRRARDSWERALSAATDESTAATIRQHIATSLL